MEVPGWFEPARWSCLKAVLKMSLDLQSLNVAGTERPTDTHTHFPSPPHTHIPNPDRHSLFPPHTRTHAHLLNSHIIHQSFVVSASGADPDGRELRLGIQHPRHRLTIELSTLSPTPQVLTGPPHPPELVPRQHPHPAAANSESPGVSWEMSVQGHDTTQTVLMTPPLVLQTCRPRSPPPGSALSVAPTALSLRGRAVKCRRQCRVSERETPTPVFQTQRRTLLKGSGGGGCGASC